MDASIVSNSQSEFLSASLGNFTGSFTFNFAKYSGNGDFGTTMTIKNNGSPKGIYFATISVKNSDLIVSKIIEIAVS